MIQINQLTLTHKKDLRCILEDFSLVLNDGDKAVMIGEEGNGKSTVMKWLYDPSLVEDYIEYTGNRVLAGERLGYLPQELPAEEKQKTVYEFFSETEAFWDQTPKDLAFLAKRFSVETEFFYQDQTMGSLSGGEKIKAQLMRLFMQEPTVLLMDEPSNDLDIQTLELLERIINEWDKILLFISHDETLIERTANMVIHLELVRRKTQSRYTVVRMPYRRYVEERLHLFERQKQQAFNEKREMRIRDEKIQKIRQSVESKLDNIAKADRDAAGRLLKKKMKAVKSMEKRFDREDENRVENPEQEEAIDFKIGSKEQAIPNGKTILEMKIPELAVDLDESGLEKRILVRDLQLTVRGPEKICLIGQNGSGKTTLMKRIAADLMNRKDIKTAYMPQNYEEMLNLDITPVEYLAPSGEKEETTKVRTYLGALKYTTDEMEHAIRELSGGQKAKIFLLQMTLSGANVLVLDEPTRNFSPLSGPVIRGMLRDFPGTIISISHDRKYIEEVCDRVYEITEGKLKLKE